MLKIKDFKNGIEYKFEDKCGVELFGVGQNFNGDNTIFGTIEYDQQKFLTEWDFTGELYRTHCAFEDLNFNLTPIIELKPCPFCGSEHLSMIGISGSGNWAIECKCCDIFVNTYNTHKGKAVLKWNGRA